MNTTMVKKELKESFEVSKGIWWLIISSLFLSGICMLVINVRELGFLAQTEVIQYIAKLSMFLSILVTMVLGSASFVAEREESTLESLMLAPISKTYIALSKLFGILIMGALVYLISLPYMLVLGWGTGLIKGELLFMLVVGTVLLVAYGCISVSLSILLQSSKASILFSIVLLLLTAIPAFIEGLLKTTKVGAVINKVGPISNAFKLMSAMIVERQPFSYMIQFLVPIAVFLGLSILFLAFATRQITFKGEK